MKVGLRHLFLLVLLPVLADAPLMQAGFSFDDLHSVAHNPHLESIQNVPRFFADPSCFSSNPKNRMYRPVLLSSYALNRLLGGSAAWSWHLFNLILHLLVVQILYRLVLCYFPERPGLALGTAALFALHPLHVELVGHVCSRSDLLLALFCSGALLLLARDLSRPHPGYLVAAWVLHALALLSKEPALLFPLAALPLLLCLPGPKRSRAARLSVGLGPMVLVGAGFLLLRRRLLGLATAAVPSWSQGVDPMSGWGRDLVTQLSSQLAALGRGVELLFVPWRLSADHQIPLVSSPLAAPALFGLMLVGLFLAGLLVLARPRRLGLAGLGWAALFLAPVVLLPLNQLFAEHRLYAPGLGLALALSAATRGVVPALRAWRESSAWPGLLLGRAGAGRAPLLCGLGLLLLMGGRSFRRALDWRDQATLWEATLTTDPGSFRAWSELGQFRAEQGDVAGALACFRRARHIYPRNLPLALNQIEYGVRTYEAGGDPGLLEECLELAEQTVSRAPWSIGPRVKLCRVRLARAQRDAASPEPRDAALAVEALFSGLTFTSFHPAQLGVLAMALEGAGQEEALDPFWGWAERLVVLDGETWRQRLDQLLRLGRAREAAALLGSYLRAAGPRADPNLVRRIRALAGCLHASPPR